MSDDGLLTYWLYRQLVRADWWTTLGNDNGRASDPANPTGTKQQGKNMADLDIEGFLGHDPSGGGFERGKFLRGWKKRKPSEVNIWLHTKVMFSSLWQHNLPRIVTRKDKESGDEKVEIWGNSWVCWEREEVLSNRKRDYHTGERESPIEVCPVCKMIEWVRRAIRQGSLNGEDPILRYVTPDGDDERIIHAAGIYGGLEDVDEEALKASKIKLRDAWRENANSKCQYVFTVVDHDAPEDGVQVAVETSLLGDKTKAVIRRKRKKNGEESDWNPLVTPYAFCWEYHESAKVFNEKYDADDRPKLVLTEEIRALIEGEPPTEQLERLKARGKLRQLREQLEQYALIEMPFDEFFADAEAKEKEQGGEGDGDFPYGANEEDAEIDPEALAKADAAMAEASAKTQAKVQAQVPAAKPASKVAPATQKPAPAAATKPAATAKPGPKEEPPQSAAEAQEPAKPTGRRKVEVKPKVEEVFVKCDDCPVQMREDWEKCPGCGATYGVEPEIKAKYAGMAPEPKPDAGTHGDNIKW